MQSVPAGAVDVKTAVWVPEVAAVQPVAVHWVLGAQVPGQMAGPAGVAYKCGQSQQQ